MMKNTMSKVITASLLSCVAFSFAHAADENTSKAEMKKQIQVCTKKKQGDWVTYANKGVTFNGTCEPNENGKLQFSFPAPAGGNPTSTAAPEPVIENRPAVEQPAIAQPSQTAPSENPTQVQ